MLVNIIVFSKISFAVFADIPVLGMEKIGFVELGNAIMHNIEKAHHAIYIDITTPPINKFSSTISVKITVLNTKKIRPVTYLDTTILGLN